MAASLNAVMAAGNNGDTHAVSGTSLSTTGITIAAGTDRVLVVTLNWQQSGGSAPASRSVTWNGVAMTERAFVNNASSNDSAGIYTLVNPATGAQTLAASWTNTNDCYCGAVAFDGADQTTGIEAGDTVTAATGSSINVAGSSDGATVATFLTNGSEPTTSQTKFWGFDSLAPGGGGSYEIGGSGTITHSFTGAGGTSPVLAAVHVIAAAGAGNDIAATGALSIAGAAALAATGALLAAGALSVTGAADLDGTGSLAAAGSVAISGAADLDATGSLVAAGALSISGAADLSGSDIDIVAVGSLSITGAAALTAIGELLAAGSIAITGTATLGDEPVSDIAAQFLVYPWIWGRLR